MPSFAFTTTKWALRLATKLIKADTRMHNLEVIQDDMAILFTVNHFTRLETFLLPYEFLRNTGKVVWSLGAAELFVGRIGNYMRKLGTISTKDPDRDKHIVASLLRGDHPWIIFPEGRMIKDKKVIDPAGVFTVYDPEERRPPHSGAAALALRAEFYRHKLECIFDSPGQKGLEETMAMFGLESIEEVLKKRTVVIPVNITYFPIRARKNAVLRMAQVLAKDLSPRALDELSVEGTFLSADTDIDITMGEPIDIRRYLSRPEYAEIMACGDDLQKLEMDPRSLFHEATGELMRHFMAEIYSLTRVNYDHIFATIIQCQGSKPFTERSYRNRIFLCVHELKKEGVHTLHSLLAKTYRQIIYEDPSPKFHDFINLCIKERIIRREGDRYVKIPGVKRGTTDFHSIRAKETTLVIANEIEPLEGFHELVKRVVRTSRKNHSEKIRSLFLEEDHRLFDEDYEKFKGKDSHSMDVGRPFLLMPERCKAGVVLVHGYLAAPKEIRALAGFLLDRGYAVYGVRLRGHGTSPKDLAGSAWDEWYDSLNRGYVVIKTLTDRIILGGFSTGGCLALLGAGLKREKVQAVFSINAPLKLAKVSARLVPSVVTMNSLFQRIKGGETGLEYLNNKPENPHINYKRNPLTGVRELEHAMVAMEAKLGDIVAPTLIVQGSKDPIVNPSSGMDIFNKVGTPLKELTIFERDRHGIVNGDGSEDVFERVHRFLLWAKDKMPEVVLSAETAQDAADAPAQSPAQAPA